MSDQASETPAIEKQLNEKLKAAMRAKDSKTSNVIRMLKTKQMERRTASGFDGKIDDALWLDVIAAYQKQMKKSRQEFEKTGASATEALEEIDFEIGFCAEFLPKMAEEPEVREAVAAALAASGITDPKQGAG